jgi:hypothetical protein
MTQRRGRGWGIHVSRNRPPSDEIAAYVQEHITCRNRGAKPGFRCVEQAEAYRTGVQRPVR